MTEKKVTMQTNDTEPSFHLWDVSTTCPSFYKRVIQPASVSIVTTEETKRGPSLSLCTLRGPRLTSLTDRKQKEKENKRREGQEREEREWGFTHSSTHSLPSSPPVSPKTKWGEDEERGRGRTRWGKEEKRREWKNNSPFIVSRYQGERLSREQCVCLCHCEVCVCVCLWARLTQIMSLHHWKEEELTASCDSQCLIYANVSLPSVWKKTLLFLSSETALWRSCRAATLLNTHVHVVHSKIAGKCLNNGCVGVIRRAC